MNKFIKGFKAFVFMAVFKNGRKKSYAFLSALMLPDKREIFLAAVFLCQIPLATPR